MRIIGLWLALLCTASLPVGASSVTSTFEDGTLQGWVATGDVAGVTSPATGGNPGGFVSMVDQAAGGVCWIIAPSQFLGDWHAKDSLSADLTQVSYNGTHYQNVQFILTGPGGQYTHDFGERPPLGAWRTYGVPLDESAWTCNSGTWSGLLDNVTELKISMEFINGAETNGLDNVVLAESSVSKTIAEAKQMTDGASVMVDGVVTAVTGSFMYIQSEDRLAGIRVKNSFALKPGDRIRISGELATERRERCLKNAVVRSATPGALPKPFEVTNAELGGIGATSLDPALGGSKTLKETGLLVRTTGRVKQVNADGMVSIGDGSLADASVRLPASAPLPIVDSYLAVTGVSGNNDAVDPAPLVIAIGEPDILAVPLNRNLLRNPGAEEGAGGNGTVVGAIPGWTIASSFVVQDYGIDVPASQSAAIGGGRSYFCGGPDNALSSATQDINLAPLAVDADAGRLTADLSAYLASWDVQGDNMTITATFLDASGSSLGSVQIGPQGGSMSVWVAWEKSAPVPVGTRKVRVKMQAIRTDGVWNSCYADNLSFVIVKN